jgi:hypothetical protein
MFSASAVLAAAFTAIQAVVWPVLVQFGAWIAVGAAGILGFLFSPAVRKYTIAGIAVLVILAVVWINGYDHGHESGNNICKEPGFTQLRLTGKFTPALQAWAFKHNSLGAKLGCWDNSNIR